jgi:hypothetical protein
VLGAVTVLALSLGTQNSYGTSPVSYEWRFSSALSPAAPEVATGGAGIAQAIVTPGQYASGWMSTNAILGSALGIWDLGRNGTITLNNPSGLAGDSSSERLITIKITQYQDGAIYDQLAVAAMPGASLVSSSSSASAPANLGDWITQTTQWRAPAGVAASSVQITGAYDGSLIDSVVLSTAGASEPPVLSIRRLSPDNNQIEISWPATFTDMVLQSTATINDSQSWTPVTETVQVNGSVRSVILNATGSARSYRLKQP